MTSVYEEAVAELRKRYGRVKVTLMGNSVTVNDLIDYCLAEARHRAEETRLELKEKHKDES